MTPRARVLVGEGWRESGATRSFMAVSPIDDQVLGTLYPISTSSDLSDMAAAARAAQPHMAHLALHEPARLAGFLRKIATALQDAKSAIVETAHHETALPAEPRLATVEFGRTLLQLEQAAACCDAEQAAVDRALAGDVAFGEQASWRRPRRDPAAGIASMLEPLDRPVLSIGPNNFLPRLRGRRCRCGLCQRACRDRQGASAPPGHQRPPGRVRPPRSPGHGHARRVLPIHGACGAG
jgi:NADP-dependent aldehyde dehydrogenase